jgi:hypothetical protein
MDDRDLEEPVRLDLGAEELPGEVGDVVDDGLGDAPAGVADDGRITKPEPEDDRGVGSPSIQESLRVT